MKSPSQKQPDYPVTPEEWQEAVDLSCGALSLVAARSYGLVTGGPEVDVRRCDFILAEGRKIGFTPSPDAVKRFIFDTIKPESLTTNGH